MDVDGLPDVAEVECPRGADRGHRTPGREQRVHLRFSDDEHRDVREAAVRAGVTVAGFCADAAFAVARGTGAAGTLAEAASRHAELGQVQRELFAARTAVIRTGTNLNQAVAALNATGTAPVWLDRAVARCERALDQLDAVAANIHRHLR